jgi:hypothetical protein
MAPLKRAGFALAMVTSAHAALAITPPAVDRWRPLIATASAQFGVPVAWITRVIDAESGGHTRLLGQPIRSRAGAMGLMQLMPTSWAEMKTRFGLGNDPDDPHDNVMAGTAYLRLMYDRFGYPGLFAAYNAGPARYAAYLQRRASLPAETTAYLRLFTDTVVPARTPSSLSARLFALRRDLAGGATRGRPTRPTPLFAIVETGVAPPMFADDRPASQAGGEDSVAGQGRTPSAAPAHD